MSDQTISESKKRQRTAKGATEDKSAKKLKEDKKQLQQKSHEELQREETFKSWLTGLHKRRKVSVISPKVAQKANSGSKVMSLFRRQILLCLSS